VIKVVLVGLMGSGKSTVGALLATATGWTLIDTDAAISTMTGKAVRELWEEGGESAYRHMESQVVLDALSSTVSCVIAAPGGVVLDPVVRAALVDPFVVWLRADAATLAGRVRPGDHRPLVSDRPFDVLSAMAVDRSHLYEEVADVTIDTDRIDPESAATTVLEHLRRLPASR
jgi:shikimate kinase